MDDHPEQPLEQWLEALRSGEDPHQLTCAAELALTEARNLVSLIYVNAGLFAVALLLQRFDTC